MRVRNDGIRMGVFAAFFLILGVAQVFASATDSFWVKTGANDIYNRYNTNKVMVGTTNAPGAGVLFMLNGAAAIGYNTTGQTAPTNGLAVNGLFGVGTNAPKFSCEVMANKSGADTVLLVIHNNNSTNGSSASIGFEAVNGNTMTGKITNVRVGSSDYRTDFYNYTGSSLQRAMSIYQNKVCIGTTNPGTYLLAVKGKIGAQEVVVTMNGWSDFVFNDDYNLKPLEKVAEYVKTNKHLEGIPTQAEVKKNGISIGEMQAKLLQKVEELTLYTIAMKKENDELRIKVEELVKRIGR